jgi:uncharacterized membrane protein (UPF0127 family)
VDTTRVSDHTPSLPRRRYLETLATAAAVSAGAGCADLGGTADSPTSDGATPDATETPTPDPTDTTDASATTATASGTPIHAGYETTEVRVTTPDGELLGSVTAAIADTDELRVTGLSDTEFLPEDRGMLFVYDEPQGRLTYVMRRMDFPLDIVFADAEGVITSIHHVRAPDPGEDGNQIQASGRGQYVLEVNRGWTTERGVEESDLLQFDL